jgi:PLP dependent protein
MTNQLEHMPTIAQNIDTVTSRIHEAARAAGRSPNAVTLVAVSKTWQPQHIRAAAKAGQLTFGENHVQEALPKIKALEDLSLEWHFIGPIQSNKTRAIAEHFAWVHSVEREKIARRLSAARAEGQVPLQVCIQVNVSGEETKSGVAPEDVIGLARAIALLPRLALRGLMAIPRETQDIDEQRSQFRVLRELYDNLIGHGLPVDTLSMGMSHDLEAAVLEGATIVRVGTAIFGERKSMDYESQRGFMP